MSVTYNPFVSKSGFKSDGFEVDTNGNITSQNLNAVALNASEIRINGSSILGSEDSTFQIENDFIISEGSVPYVSVINGQVIVRNKSNSVGKIDNVDIGTVTPAAGVFTSVNTPAILDNDSIEFYIGSAKVGEVNSLGITIPVVDTSINNTIINNSIVNSTVIGNTNPNTGAFTALNATQAITFNTTTNNQSYTTSGAGTITITSGTTGAINNMSIGATTASTGRFTSVTVATEPTSNTELANKLYVDKKVRLAIAMSGI